MRETMFEQNGLGRCSADTFWLSSLVHPSGYIFFLCDERNFAKLLRATDERIPVNT